MPSPEDGGADDGFNYVTFQKKPRRKRRGDKGAAVPTPEERLEKAVSLVEEKRKVLTDDAYGDQLNSASRISHESYTTS